MKHIKTKNYVLALVYIVIIAALLVFGILPYFNNLTRNQSEYQKVRSDLNAALSKYTQLTKLSKDQQEINDIKDDVFELLPENPETADFVVKVEALAEDLSVPDYISSVSTSQETYSGSTTAKKKSTASGTNKSEIAYSIVFKSNYTTVESFIEKLLAFPRFTAIQSINASGYDSENDTLNFKLNGLLYYGK